METLHLAYSATDNDGIAKDVSLLLDAAEEGEALQTIALNRLEAFLRTAGLIGPKECLRTTIH
jgi:hypothetical protein